MQATKRRFVMEEPNLSNPEQETLQATLAILTPIRAHRLAKSEREWRKAKQKLKQIEAKIAEVEAHLEAKKQEHLARRQELSDQNQSQTITQQGLQDWIGEEKQLLSKLDDINRELNNLRRSLQEQQEVERQAKAQVDIKQLENERLTHLKSEIEEVL